MSLPEPGTPEYEKMIDFMRTDLESGMKYSKIIAAGRKIVEDRGGNFDEEFKKWKRQKGEKSAN